MTAAILFFASQNAPGRPGLIGTFHSDAVAQYPKSVVFCHGNFMVGVKLRQCPTGMLEKIVAAVRQAWTDWAFLVGRRPDGLSWWVDGKFVDDRDSPSVTDLNFDF
jgi:hypothetical protein